MNDLERIIEALRTAEGGMADAYTPEYYGEYADAVLAAIGDRLLPELPEGWRLCFVDWERYEGMEREYVARVERIEDEYEYRQAFGPTIPAAIANALQEGSADE